MNAALRTRLPWLLWTAAVVGWLVLVAIPVSYGLSRGASVVFALAAWFGLIALTWPTRALRLVLLAVTVAIAAFLVSPARDRPSAKDLRDEYVAALRRYEGVAYVWGGEGSLGIDCSGLIRRGRVDAMFLRGLSSFDAGLVRSAASLWWNDCTAKALGEGQDGTTAFLADAASVNAADVSRLEPGDLAVTRNGLHVMAYLGDAQWIEADPGVQRVIIVRTPVEENAWFDVPVRVVRWTALRE